MVIARVFPSKTRYTPDDDLALFGPPDMFSSISGYDEIHVSCVFTWDKSKAESLAEQWSHVCSTVKIGGPAFDDAGGVFTPGMYTKQGLIITSRGCPRRCPFCFVPKREGYLRELPVTIGNVVMDNNLLACSDDHVARVFDMLGSQRHVTFQGGIDTYLLKDWHINRLAELKGRLAYLYIAYDTDQDKDSVESALVRLYLAGMKQRNIGCYVLIGYKGDTPEKAERRCEWAFSRGAIPFAMYYRGPSESVRIKKTKEWNAVYQRWCNLPSMFSRIKREGLKQFPIVRGQFADRSTQCQ